MLILYQFPISHFCEKIRWALDHKQLEYQVINLLPGPHIAKLKKLAPKSNVPVLVHNQNIIQNSSTIITYLDKTFPSSPLTPEQEKEKKASLEWEKYLDKEVGTHVRLFVYSFILDHPSITIPLLCHNSPWYTNYIFKIIFPGLRKKMIQMMKINEQTAQQSKQHLEQALDKIYSHLQEHQYLVSNTFTRADLTAASLLAPICKPDGYGLTWPRYPDELETFIEENQQKLAWVNRMYTTHR